MGEVVVAFDYDGVLVDTYEANKRLINNALKAMGSDVVVSEEHFECVEEISFEAVTAAAGLDPKDFPDFMVYVYENGYEVTQQSTLFDGMRDLLESLSGKVHMAVVSNNHSMVLEDMMAKEDLRELFVAITGADSGASKEERLMQIAEKHGADLANCWMVGDGLNDIESAHIAGWKSIAVSWGYQSLDRLKKANPTAHVTTPGDIKGVVL